MAIALVAVGTLLVVVGAVVLARHVPHPEQTAGHGTDDPTTTTSERFYRGVDRPAGPDAEGGGAEPSPAAQPPAPPIDEGTPPGPGG